MPRRPQFLRFANAERPPLPLLLSLAAQHASFSIIYLASAVIVAKAAKFSPPQQAMFLTATIFCCGITAMMQAGSRRIGSGLLIVPIASSMFIELLIEAGAQGGMGTASTVVLAIGAIQIAMGPLVYRARSFFPPEVCGVVTAMLGFTIAHTAMNQIPELAPIFDAGTSAPADEIVALVTLCLIAAGTVWLPGAWRSFAMLLGVAAGYGLAWALNCLPTGTMLDEPALTLSLPHVRLPSFDVPANLIPSILLMGVVSTVYSMGILISTDRLEDADWKSPNLSQVAHGVSGLGIGNVITAFFGGTAMGLTGLSTALAFSSGVTSRCVGLAAGVLLVVLSLFAGSAHLFVGLPTGVLAGLLGYVGIYLVATGFQLALSRMMSPRRLLVIGLPICAGIYALSHQSTGSTPAGIAAAIRHSPLALTTFLALVLNLLTRLGITQQANRAFAGGAAYEDILHYFEELGERWGLRQGTVSRASGIASEVIGTVGPGPERVVDLTVRHDEVNLDVTFSYSAGHEGEADWQNLGQLADRVNTSTRNGTTRLDVRLSA